MIIEIAIIVIYFLFVLNFFLGIKKNSNNNGVYVKYLFVTINIAVIISKTISFLSC